MIYLGLSSFGPPEGHLFATRGSCGPPGGVSVGHQGHLGALLWPAGWHLEATWGDLEFFMMVIADVAEACGCFAEA